MIQSQFLIMYYLQSINDAFVYENRRFDPDYYMANSFVRLRDGTPNHAAVVLLSMSYMKLT